MNEAALARALVLTAVDVDWPRTSEEQAPQSRKQHEQRKSHKRDSNPIALPKHAIAHGAIADEFHILQDAAVAHKAGVVVKHHIQGGKLVAAVQDRLA